MINRNPHDRALGTELLCGTQAHFLHQHLWVHPLNKRNLYVMDNRHGQW
jgi:hypothetical protein